MPVDGEDMNLYSSLQEVDNSTNYKIIRDPGRRIVWIKKWYKNIAHLCTACRELHRPAPSRRKESQNRGAPPTKQLMIPALSSTLPWSHFPSTVPCIAPFGSSSSNSFQLKYESQVKCKSYNPFDFDNKTVNYNQHFTWQI